MDIRHTPTHSPLTLRVSGVTGNSAFPTRLRRALPLTPSHRHPSPRRIGDALLTSRLCHSLPHVATPAHGASEMRYSLETPFVRSAAEDAWGHSRPTPSALRRCATPPPARPRSADLIVSRSSGGVRPRERSRLQLTPDSVGGTRIDAHAPRSAAAGTLRHIYSKIVCICHTVSE